MNHVQKPTEIFFKKRKILTPENVPANNHVFALNSRVTTTNYHLKTTAFLPTPLKKANKTRKITLTTCQKKISKMRQ